MPKALAYQPHAQWIVTAAYVSGILVLLRFVLLVVPEQLPFGEELGQLVNALSLSYLSAYIFNYLVVALPRRRERKHALEVSSPLISKLIHDFRQLLGQIYESGNVPHLPSRDSLESALAARTPTELIRPAEWHGVADEILASFTFERIMTEYGQLAERTTERLFPMLSNLDASLAAQLFAIPNNVNNETYILRTKRNYSGDSLASFTSTIFTLWQKMVALEEVFDRELERESLPRIKAEFRLTKTDKPA